MKKLALLFFSILAVGFVLQSCDNTKTYAEMLQDEKNAINSYIKKNKITVITPEEFLVDTVTAENEYVLFSDGVYMNIVDRGSGAAPADRDNITVRFTEFDIINDTTTLSNVDYDQAVDAFYYTISGTSALGQFEPESYMYFAYGSAVPAGWMVPLPYIKNKAHVKLIVPAKMGHTTAQQMVTPYFYDLKKIQIQ